MPQLPALAVKPLDIANVLMAVEQIRASRTRNSLMQANIEGERAATAARQNLFAGGGAGAAPAQAPANALATNQGQATPPAATGAPAGGGGRKLLKTSDPAVQQYLALDPKNGPGIVDAISKMNKDQLAETNRVNDMRGRASAWVESQPQDQRPAAYEQALAQLEAQGVSTKGMSPQYNPGEVQAQMGMALSLDKIIEQSEPIDVAPGHALVDPKTRKAFYTAPTKPDNALVETYDAQSPSGTRLTPRTEAAGLPGKGSAGGQDPARIREAQILVDKNVYPDFKTAYSATRQKVTVDPQSARIKGLAWVSGQKDRYKKPKYASPEEQNAALEAYMLWIDGDNEGALAALATLEKVEPKDEPNWAERKMESLWRSMTGSTGEPLEAKEPAEPAATGGATRAGPDGKKHKVVSDKAAYDALKPGEIYYDASRNDFFKKGQ